MADDIKLSKAEIEELRSLVRLLKEDISEAEFQNLLKSGPAAKKMLRDLRVEATEFTSDVGGVIESFNRLMNEIKGTNSGVNKVLGAFKGINKLAEEIQYAQRGITSLSEKDLAKIQEKMAMKALDLENANKILEIEKTQAEKTKKFNEDQLDFYQKEKEKLDNKTVWTDKDLKRYDTLEKLEKKANERLEKTQKELDRIAKSQGDIEGILNKQDGHYNTLLATLAKLKRELKDQNELLGLGGAIVGSLDTALGQLGFGRLAGALGISEASAEMDEFAKQIVKDREKQLILEKEITDEVQARAKGQGTLSPEVLAEKQSQLEALKGQNAQYDGINGKLAVLKKGISSMGASLVKNLTDPVALTVGFVTQLIGALKTSDEATGKLAKQFGTSYKEASNMRQELNSIANSSFNVNISTKDLQESLMAVNQALGTNGKLNEADLITMSELTKQAGYTHDELMGIEKLSLAQGKSLNDNVKLTLGSAKAHAATRGLMINEREVLKEVNKMSASLKLSLGGSVDRMAEAVVKTKALGLSIEQAEKMASGLLEFESSISSELEAEVLTGKSLNFEKARLLALNNDVAGAAEEIVKQVEKAGDFTKMNRIQQEAVAKAAGMTRDELAQSIIDKKALAKLDVEGAKTAKEAYEKLKQQGLSEQQIREKLGDVELAQQLESQSLQEKFNATVEKLKEIFVSLADPLLKIFNLFSVIFKVIGGIASGIGFVINKVVEFGNYLDDLTGGALSGVLGTVLKIGVGISLIGLAVGKLGPIFSSMMTPVKALGKGLVYSFKEAKEGLSSLRGGFKSMLSEIKEKGIGGAFKDAFTSVKDKISGKSKAKNLASKVAEMKKQSPGMTSKEALEKIRASNKDVAGGAADKAGNLADKAKDKADKVSDSTKGGDNAKGFADRMKNIAKGIKAFGDAKVILGALIGLPAAAVGLIAMLPGVLGAKAIETLDGKKLKSSLEGLAKGIEAMASGKVAAGAGALILVSIGLTAMLPGVLGALAIQSIDGKAVKKALEGLAGGLEAMANGKAVLGALALIPVSLGLIAMIPGFLGVKLIEKIDGKAVKKGLEGLADGLEAMAKGKVLLGAGALVVVSVALVAALPGMLAAAALGAIGPLIEKGLTSFAKGIERLGTGKVFLGAAALAALGLALIPAAYALKQFSEVSWSDLGKAGVALLGLGIAGAAFGSFVPLMLAGAVAIAALGASLIPFGIALRIIAPALEKFTPIIEAFGNVISKTFSGIAEVITSAFTGLSDLFKTLGEVDPIKLFAIGPALASIGAGLAVLGGGSLAGGILGSIGKLFGGGVVEKLNELSSIDSSKILTLADAITKLSESIANLNNVTANVGDVSPIITTVDKVVELHDSLNKTSLEKVVDKVSEGVSSLFSKAFEFVSSVSSTDKTTANAESTTSASSLSSATSSKSLSDIVSITAKEVTLTISDKVIFDIINKSKEETSKTANKTTNSDLISSMSSSIDDAVKSTETNKTSSLNAVSALNKADLSNLIVNAENVSVVKSKTSEENKSSILDIFNPIKMISTITDLFTGKSETETTQANLAESSLTKTNLTDNILNTAANTKNITSADKTKSSLLAVNNIADAQSKNITTKTEFNKLEEELLTGEKTNELISTSVDNLKVANLIVEKQTEGKTDSTKGAIAGATIGSFLGPLGALAGGLIGEMFSGTNEEEIVPINNEIQPLDQTISTLNNANNTNASSLVNNNQNITSNENVVKILQEAVNVLKAIQAKDTSVQLAIDGDVIARKITPNINREQVKTYSNIS